MVLYAPSLQRLRQVAERHGLDLDDEELELLAALGTDVSAHVREYRPPQGSLFLCSMRGVMRGHPGQPRTA